MSAGEPSTRNLPGISGRRLRLFLRYLTFYFRRNFHGLHLARMSPAVELEGRPVLVCLNHPSWWDAVVALYLSWRLFPERSNYGPIAGAGLSKYKFFERLGFFGIEPGTRAGAAKFLHIGQQVLQSSDCALWVTPQGHFTDVRKRPVTIEAGVGHLARRCNGFYMLPIAIEYAFWTERHPEAFACLGRPVFVEAGRELSAQDWNLRFAAALEEAQDYLSVLVQRRDPGVFEPLLAGGAGVGGVYDQWRALTARLRGRKFEAEHGRV
jgi:1-acyl-sn-glycerol-3-phosphate acyltransferase